VEDGFKISRHGFLALSACDKAFYLRRKNKSVETPLTHNLFHIDEREELSLLARKYIEKVNTDITIINIEANGSDFSVDYQSPDFDITHEIHTALVSVSPSLSVKAKVADGLALTVYQAEKSGKSVKSVTVLYVNRDYVKRGEIDPQKLFLERDLTQEACEGAQNVERVLERGKKILELTEEPNVDIDDVCFSSNCRFFDYCTRNLPQDNIFHLRKFNRSALEYYKKGYVVYGDLLKAGAQLDKLQKLQGAASECDSFVNFEKKNVKAFLSKLVFPLYFLDFEAYDTVIPLFDGLSPYPKAPFQYSLHVLSEDGTLEHREYLGDPNVDCREELAKTLYSHLGYQGSIIVYDKTLESQILYSLGREFKRYGERLHGAIRRIVDFIEIFKSGAVYIKEMNGSISLKSVLPAMYPNVKELSYSDLSGVHDGAEAPRTYLKMRDMSKTEREEARENLLAYCGLDTMATVKIYEYLVKNI
jgi:hypothetical protein